MTPWRYWLDFYMFPPIIVGAVIYDCRSWQWAALAVLGFVFWTFNEYWVHRSVLHRWLWHGTHERHHDHPEEFVENIWWYTPLLFFLIFWVLPLSLYTGFAAGYVWFLTMHFWLPHTPLRPGTWIYRFALWHGLHHKFTTCNYGITTNIWDKVFRTSREPRHA